MRYFEDGSLILRVKDKFALTLSYFSLCRDSPPAHRGRLSQTFSAAEEEHCPFATDYFSNGAPDDVARSLS